MTPDSNKRIAGLDLVRTIACMSVIATHFFLNSGFRKAEFEGVSMFLQGMGSSVAVSSDLYMILTGFLCCNKTFGMAFYRSGVKVILSYLFFSIITIAVNVYFLDPSATWEKGLTGILGFSTIPYAWYIEMWIGLFLLAPFLNLTYKSISSRSQKLWLIAILIALTALPEMFNRFGRHVYPRFWEDIYPLAFYFMGCYIREYRPKMRLRTFAVVALAIMLISPIATLCKGYHYFYLMIGDRKGIFMMAFALSTFLTFYHRDVKSSFWRGAFKKISLRSLDIFLCSAMLDAWIYPMMKERYYTDQAHFGIYFFVIVPIVFALCYLIASAKRVAFHTLSIALRKVGIDFPLQSYSKV